MSYKNQSSVKEKAVQGMFWSSFGSFSFQIIRTLTQIILARLLWPEAFGLFAIVMAFISIAQYLIENGLTLYLIRKKDLELLESSTLFYSNIIFSLIIFLGFLVFSPYISSEFNDNQVGIMLILTSISLIFNAFTSVHKALLTRALKFKGQSLINLSSTISAGIISIALAYFGFGIYTLVLYTVLFQLLVSIQLIIIYPFKPIFGFDWKFFKSSLIYSWKLMVSGLIHTAYENIFNILLAGVYSVSTLGFYTNALKIRDGAAQTLTDSIQKVSFPYLSTMQDSKEALRENTKVILRMSSFIIFPILLGLAATGQSIVMVLFGDKWLGMVAFIEVLSINGLLIPLHKINLNVMNVIGRTDIYLKLEIIKKGIALLSLGISFYFELSIINILWVLFLNAFLGWVINALYTGKYIGYGLLHQTSDIFPSFLSASLMALVVYLIPNILHTSTFITLLMQVIVGGLVYVLLGKLLIRKEFDQLLSVIKNLKSKIIKKGT